MKIAMLSPQDLPGNIDERDLAPEVEPPEYVMTFPVPGPDSPGEFVFLSLTPDGRPAAILADSVTAPPDGAVRVTCAGQLVAMLPKEAPWMLLRRDLLRYTTRAEARRAMAEAYRGVLPMLGDPTCPVHGVHGDVDKSDKPEAVAGDAHPGQYL